MSEGEVVAELVEFTNIVMVGVSLIFSIVSAYVVALNYFIGSANLLARFGSFLFITLTLGMLMVVMMGAQATHAGLIARLAELEAQGQLTAAGLTMTIFFYIAVNLMMVMGLAPVVGIPLPLFSYGGSSMISLAYGMGMLLGLMRTRPSAEQLTSVQPAALAGHTA